MGGLVIPDEEEEALTRAHAIQAMRKMLRSPADVQQSMYYLGLPEAKHALHVIKRVARGQCQYNAADWKVRAAAAEVLLIWGLGWHVERLLWLGVLKPPPPAAPEEDGWLPRKIDGRKPAEEETKAEATGGMAWRLLGWLQGEQRSARAGKPQAPGRSSFRLLLPNNVFQIMRHVMYVGGEGDVSPGPFPAVWTPKDLARCEDGVTVAVLDSLLSHQEEASVMALPQGQRHEDVRHGFLQGEPHVQVKRLAKLWDKAGPATLKVKKYR